MDADDVEPLAADVLELVGRLWADDEDVAGAGLDFFPAGGEKGPAARTIHVSEYGWRWRSDPAPGSL